MDEQHVTRITLQQYRTSSSYSEQETATVSHVSISTIHNLRAMGMIEGQEADGEWRYSEQEVIQLRRIRRLQQDLGVNLAGVEVILHLLKRLDTVCQELEQEKNRAKDKGETQ
jgi:MerR family transcriptional regulator/heat shock protein HspR